MCYTLQTPSLANNDNDFVGLYFKWKGPRSLVDLPNDLQRCPSLSEPVIHKTDLRRRLHAPHSVWGLALDFFQLQGLLPCFAALRSFAEQSVNHLPGSW